MYILAKIYRCIWLLYKETPLRPHLELILETCMRFASLCLQAQVRSFVLCFLSPDTNFGPPENKPEVE